MSSRNGPLTPSGKPRGKCPECNRSVMLLKDNRIGKHGHPGSNQAAPVWPPQNCPGWGKPAKEES